ncbi:MAG TPA: TonB-dependent receptor, partial [Flavobacteriales bacterium]|nr:TonB-dependent receptor [Flavobacteriales bacterium]
SPINYYNFAEDRNIKGNPALTQAEVESWDMRLEYFPQPGEVLAVSLFSKDFTNAIEDTLLANPERYVQTWTNSPSAKNRGVELEARKNLGFLWRHLAPFTLTANYFTVDSEVEYIQAETTPEGEVVEVKKTRLLQGQAPWAVNLSLLWEHPRWGTSLNVLYNRVGRRLDKVGDSEETNIYLMPRELLDVAWVQRLGRTWRMKATVKNLLDEQETYLWGADELPFETRAYGVSAGLSFAASF